MSNSAEADVSKKPPEPLPPITLKACLQFLAAVLVIGGGITAIVMTSGKERDAVRKYVSLLREGKTPEAHQMLASARASKVSIDGLKQTLYTSLLSKTTDLTVTSARGSGPGKSCVRTAVEHPGGSEAVYFYIVDEGGPKIHTILTNADFKTDSLFAASDVEPWSCS